MTDLTWDVAVIGAGTAGLAARDAATEAGASTLLIEVGPYGTTCARVGCMPSKLLIEAGDAAHGVSHAALFGVHVGPGTIDGAAVMQRVRAERDRFVAGVLREVEAIPRAERLTGHARFLDANTLAVGEDTRVTARAVVVATGARPTLPKPLPSVAERVLTHESVFEIDSLPETMAVLGAGPLGLELAQAFARLGVRVTLLDPGQRIGGLRDDAISRVVAEVIGGELDLCLGAEVAQASVDGDGVRLIWTDAQGGEQARTFARVLVAAGRPPALDGLDLDKAGLDLDEHGLPQVDQASLQCGRSAIFLAGDADHDRPVLHEASRQGTIAGRNAARYPDVEVPPRWVFLSMVFTDPGLAIVGRTADADRGDRSACLDYADQGRARMMGRNRGLLKVHADRDGTLVGAEMAMPGAEHVAHLIAWAVQEGMTAAHLLDRPFYHPTIEEGLKHALNELVGRTG